VLEHQRGPGRASTQDRRSIIAVVLSALDNETADTLRLNLPDDGCKAGVAGGSERHTM